MVPPKLLVSAIIPALNEERAIQATVEAVLRVPQVGEAIVVDGGSGDSTAERAGAAGAIVLSANRGRGSQMAAGAQRATHPVLWFVHADTMPPGNAGSAIEQALADPNVAGGHFRPRFTGDFASARFLTWLYPHLALLGLKYGDGSLFVRRRCYDAVGGFRPYPLFEDLDLLRRLRTTGRMVQLRDEVATSSRRFSGRNFAVVFAGWTGLQVLYWLGVSPHVLARWYSTRR